MHTVFLAVLIAIAVMDLLCHKIYNFSFIILIIVGSLAGLAHFNFASSLFAFLLAIALGVMRAGGGDIKFALLVLPFFLPHGSISQYLSYFSIIAAAQLIIHATYAVFFKRISFKSQYLALGPALAGALALVHY